MFNFLLSCLLLIDEKLLSLPLDGLLSERSGLAAKMPQLVVLLLFKLHIFAITNCLIFCSLQHLLYFVAFVITLQIFVSILPLNHDWNWFARCIVSIFWLFKILFQRNLGSQFRLIVKNLHFFQFFLKFLQT
jgi:hypothetical protein